MNQIFITSQPLIFLQNKDKDSWELFPLKESEVFKILTEQNWVSSPKNKLLFGDVYRVGAEMLLDIKYSLGDSAFYEVLADSSLLMKKYQQIKKVN